MANDFIWRAVLPHCRKFSAHLEMRPPVFQPALAGFVFVATDFSRWGKNGRAKFLPSRKRQRLATGDWRLQRQKLLSAENFSAVQELCPPEKPFATHYSPFATRRSLLATHYSPFATRCRFPSPFSVSPLHRFSLSPFPCCPTSPLHCFPAFSFPAFCLAAMMAANA
jgi:hypothetical protein